MDVDEAERVAVICRAKSKLVSSVMLLASTGTFFQFVTLTGGSVGQAPGTLGLLLLSLFTFLFGVVGFGLTVLGGLEYVLGRTIRLGVGSALAKLTVAGATLVVPPAHRPRWRQDFMNEVRDLTPEPWQVRAAHLLGLMWSVWLIRRAVRGVLASTTSNDDGQVRTI